MDAKQLLELIITPTHNRMGGNYQSDSADLLSLCTAAIESDCGHYIKQVNGPALGPWQMEPDTHADIWFYCDALTSFTEENQTDVVEQMIVFSLSEECIDSDLIDSPKYACAMSRLKYSMDPSPLPEVTGNRKTDERNFYNYYKRVYNTELGKSTFTKWQVKMKEQKIFEVFYESRGYSK